jgi:2-amino-4-hydroxy-6-hydroxymethyldihydropteridine diphosphokinase
LGNKEQNLHLCRHLLSDKGILQAVSKIYQTEPWGFTSEHEFLNQAIQYQSNLKPEALLDFIQYIERTLGRQSAERSLTEAKTYTDRIIDVDILMAGDDIFVSDRLLIPHPHLHERIFALKPLCDIAPKLIHPILKTSNAELLQNLLNNPCS